MREIYTFSTYFYCETKSDSMRKMRLTALGTHEDKERWE
jgi:hypothetical protein